MTKLDIGIALPTIGNLAPPGFPGIAAAARHVEQVGLDTVGIADLVTGDGMPSLDSVVVAATAATATERIDVEFGVLVLPLRPVATLAAQIATLQHLSGDRLVLGVGSGGFPEAPYWSALGVRREDRGRLTDAALDVLPRLVAGESARLEPGQPELQLAPGASVPPSMIGGGPSKVTFERVLRYGDGWAPSLLPPDDLARAAADLRARAVDAGRARPVVGYGSHAAVGDDTATREAGEAFVRSYANDHGQSEAHAREVLVSGGPARIAESLAAYADAGVDRISFALEGHGWMRQVELVAEARGLLR